MNKQIQKEKYRRYMFCVMIVVLITLSILLPISWTWRIIFASAYLILGFIVLSIDTAKEIPDDIPMSPEEQAIQKEIDRNHKGNRSEEKKDIS